MLASLARPPRGAACPLLRALCRSASTASKAAAPPSEPARPAPRPRLRSLASLEPAAHRLAVRPASGSARRKVLIEPSHAVSLPPLRRPASPRRPLVVAPHAPRRALLLPAVLPLGPALGDKASLRRATAPAGQDRGRPPGRVPARPHRLASLLALLFDLARPAQLDHRPLPLALRPARLSRPCRPLLARQALHTRPHPLREQKARPQKRRHARAVQAPRARGDPARRRARREGGEGGRGGRGGWGRARQEGGGRARDGAEEVARARCVSLLPRPLTDSHEQLLMPSCATGHHYIMSITLEVYRAPLPILVEQLRTALRSLKVRRSLTHTALCASFCDKR